MGDVLVITYQEPALLNLPVTVSEGSPWMRRFSMHFLTPSLLSGDREVQQALLTPVKEDPSWRAIWCTSHSTARFVIWTTYYKPWSNIFLRISKEGLFLMNAVIDVPSVYPTAGQTSQSKEKNTSLNWFIYWSASEATKYIVPLISCAQRYSDDRIDTIIYRWIQWYFKAFLLKKTWQWKSGTFRDDKCTIYII